MISKYLIQGELKKIEDYLTNLDNVDIDKYSDTHFAINIILNDSFRVSICFYAKSNRHSDTIMFYLEFEQIHGSDSFIGIVPKKELVPEEVLNLGKYHAGRYHIDKDCCLSESVRIAIDSVLNNLNQLTEMCQKSTCWNNDGTLKHRYSKWNTEATLLNISKEYPVTRMYTGISRHLQNNYDLNPDLHGSNGSYVQNVNPEWTLLFRVKRAGIESDTSAVFAVNVHQFITNNLMPKLGWERITESRLENLNQSIRGKKIKVYTNDMEVAPIDRAFYPTDKNNWEELLNDILEKL